MTVPQQLAERPLPPNVRQEIKQHLADGALMAHVDPEQDTPGAVIGAIDVFLSRWQAGDRPDLDENDDVPLALGSLWGQQLVEALGWQWSSVMLPGKGRPVSAIGVFSRDRALALYPFHAVRACLEKGSPVNVRLVFNALMEGTRFHGLAAGGYRNVLEMAGRK
jgi:hypothetical protein